ncbi:MAG: hypothetical protein ACPG5P_03985, partial [Saprospiraceae bacterium]
DVEVPPKATMKFAKAYNKKFFEAGQNMKIALGSEEIEIPKGYLTESANIIVGIPWHSDGGPHTENNLVIFIGEKFFHFYNGDNNNYYFEDDIPLEYLEGILPFNYRSSHVSNNFFTLNIMIHCILDPKVETEWKIRTHRAIIDAYERKRAEYLARLAEAEATELYKIEGRNSHFNRNIEKSELKKGCLKWMFDRFAAPGNYQDYGFGAWSVWGHDNSRTCFPPVMNTDRQALAEGQKAKYMDNAFDWELMTYKFFPYYWAANKCRWVQTSGLEDGDHIFQQFLQSGMARVMVPVRPGMEKSILHFLSSGIIYEGDNLPNLPGIYTDIIQDLDREDDFSDIPVDEREWEMRIPTTLTALQCQSGCIDEKGLPCNCKDHQQYGIGIPFIMEGMDDGE